MNKDSLILRMKHVLTIIVLLWVVFFISKFIPLLHLGITPRSSSGLLGIVFSPFLHGHLMHIITNSISLLVLGTIMINLETRYFYSITILLVIIGGLGTWLIGRTGSNHVGASGVIYGYIGYLFTTGIFNKSIKTILVSVIVIFLYAGAIFGIFPTVSKGISWEGHLSGFVAGIILSWHYAKYYKQ